MLISHITIAKTCTNMCMSLIYRGMSEVCSIYLMRNSYHGDG
jgi:hypothetical protein